MTELLGDTRAHLTMAFLIILVNSVLNQEKMVIWLHKKGISFFPARKIL